MTFRQLLELLRDTDRRLDWAIDEENCIRANCHYCPVTAACLIRTGEEFWSSDFKEAADRIGMDHDLAFKIVAAADNLPGYTAKEIEEIIGMRMQLEEALYLWDSV